MSKNSLKVALNMSQLSVPEKINKATFIAQSITANVAVFITPNPSLTAVGSAIDQLEFAFVQTADGGKSKTVQMHDKEAALMNLMQQLAQYVQNIAAGDESIVHLAGMEVKQAHPALALPELRAIPVINPGEVKLAVKPRKGSLYKWQYRADASQPWADSLQTHVSKATIGGLATGIYWFRVIFMDGTGNHEGPSLRVAVL